MSWIYNEVPGEYGRWNQETIGSGLPSALRSDEIIAFWVKLYHIAPAVAEWSEVSSMKLPIWTLSGCFWFPEKIIADVVLRIIADSSFLENDSVGIADPDIILKAKIDQFVKFS